MSDNPYNFFFLDDEDEKETHEDFGETAEKAELTEETDIAESAPESKKSTGKHLLHSAFALPVLCLLCGCLFVILMLLLPETAAAVGYPLGWLVTSLYLYQGHHRSFLRPLIPCVITVLLAALVAFVWGFLAQTELYTIFDYFAHGHVWANCLFQTALCLVLVCFGIYITLPSKKKAQRS